MKNWNDLVKRFTAELEQWYIRQTRKPFENYYLYYLESTAEHDGGIIIHADSTPPENPDYRLAAPEAIRKDMDIGQNVIYFEHILKRLPVLSLY